MGSQPTSSKKSEVNSVVRKSRLFITEFSEAMMSDKVEFDLNGHFCGGTRVSHKGYMMRELAHDAYFMLDDEEKNHLLGVMRGEIEPDRWLSLKRNFMFQCSECGENPNFEFDGRILRAKTKCPYPDGLTYEWELNVPSGKMVVANDLRDTWKIIGDFNVNYSVNCMKTTMKYAEVGMSHAIVSNTSPGVYRINNGKFVIGTSDENERSPVKGARQVGSICTDLWWYSIVDYDDYVKRLGEPDTKKFIDVVKCKPGVYRFRHLFHIVDFDDPGVVFTEIEWVRDPDPIKDTAGIYDNLNFTAEQIIADKLRRDSDLWGATTVEKNKTGIIQRIADHLMCVGGNGCELHPKGWVGSNPDLTMDAPEIDIPIFDQKYHWYPLDEHSFICAASGVGKDWDFHNPKPSQVRLNESFVRLAFNVCHCIAKYGVQSSYKDEKKTQKWGLKSLKGFVKKYPDLVPDYVKKFLKGGK
jgi:hypothetical protein